MTTTNINNSNNNSNSNNTTMNNVKTTSVHCPKCGAEFAIPEHESIVHGIAIGKDSMMGRITLPLADNAEGSEISSDMEAALIQLLKSTPGMAEVFAKVMDKIEETGYIEVPNIVRRFVPKHTLDMLYKYSDKRGYVRNLENRGSDYPWKVILRDLKKQAKLWAEGDKEGVEDLNRWYNKEVLMDMARHYFNELKEHVGKLRKHTHRCKGNPYITLRSSVYNHRKGVFIDQISDVYRRFETFIGAIQDANTPDALYRAAVAFNDFRKTFGFQPEKYCKAFVNAYKAVGGYYTAKDLIMFEGCTITVHQGSHAVKLDTEESLRELEAKASEVARDYAGRSVSGEDGYKMLGFLKEMLKDNNFNYDTTVARWRQASVIRRKQRQAIKNRRARK